MRLRGINPCGFFGGLGPSNKVESSGCYQGSAHMEYYWNKRQILLCCFSSRVRSFGFFLHRRELWSSRRTQQRDYYINVEKHANVFSKESTNQWLTTTWVKTPWLAPLSVSVKKIRHAWDPILVALFRALSSYGSVLQGRAKVASTTSTSPKTRLVRTSRPREKERERQRRDKIKMLLWRHPIF